MEYSPTKYRCSAYRTLERIREREIGCTSKKSRHISVCACKNTTAKKKDLHMRNSGDTQKTKTYPARNDNNMRNYGNRQNKTIRPQGRRLMSETTAIWETMATDKTRQ